VAVINSTHPYYGREKEKEIEGKGDTSLIVERSRLATKKKRRKIFSPLGGKKRRRSQSEKKRVEKKKKTVGSLVDACYLVP